MYTKRELQRGQALFEYMMIFGFMALFSVAMVKAMGKALDSTTRGVAWFLTQELNIGVCEKSCFMQGYGNK